MIFLSSLLGKVVRDPETDEIIRAGAIVFNFLTVSDFSATDVSILEEGNAALDFESAFVELVLAFAEEHDIDDLEFMPFAARSINDIAGNCYLAIEV